MVRFLVHPLEVARFQNTNQAIDEDHGRMDRQNERTSDRQFD